MKKKGLYPRPPLHMANPRVTQKRVGTQKKEDKCSIPIPPNPITQQPKGTKPTTHYIGKENQHPGNNDLRYTGTQKTGPKDSSLHVVDITEQSLPEVEKSPFKKPTGKC